MSTQFEKASAGIVASVRAGCSIEDAARTAGVAVATVRRWLREGRKGKETYRAFAEAVDGVRGDRREAERALDGPLSVEEAERLLATAARKGSVAALRIFFERLDDAGSSGRTRDARKLLAEVFTPNDN
jgi:predicted transcriptional regulator